MSTRLTVQQLNAAKKDIFNLQLENHFLKERLQNMAPDHIEAALKENVKIKLEILNLSKEMKKLKKLLTQQDKDLAEAQREREGGSGAKDREADLQHLEEMYAREKERRQVAEEWQGRAEEAEADLNMAKEKLEDQAEEIERLREAADRVEDEDVSCCLSLFGPADYQSVNALRDQLAAAQLDLERRDQEIDQLNEELDAKVRDHEQEVQQVEDEWRNEVLETRAQMEELKDVRTMKRVMNVAEFRH